MRKRKQVEKLPDLSSDDVSIEEVEDLDDSDADPNYVPSPPAIEGFVQIDADPTLNMISSKSKYRKVTSKGAVATSSQSTPNVILHGGEVPPQQIVQQQIIQPPPSVILPFTLLAPLPGAPSVTCRPPGVAAILSGLIPDLTRMPYTIMKRVDVPGKLPKNFWCSVHTNKGYNKRSNLNYHFGSKCVLEKQVLKVDCDFCDEKLASKQSKTSHIATKHSGKDVFFSLPHLRAIIGSQVIASSVICIKKNSNRKRQIE